METTTTYSEKPCGTPIKIVILEDHTLVRDSLATLLDLDPQLKVIGQTDQVDQIVDLVDQLKPDILIADIQLESPPFRQIEQCLERHDKLKAIYLTAFPTPQNIQRALKSKPSALLTKLICCEELVQTIKKVYRGETYFSKDVLPLINEPPLNAPHSPKVILSAREHDVLCLVAQGLPAKTIAQQLGISVKTVDRHKSNIMSKLKMNNQVELTRYAIKEELIKL